MLKTPVIRSITAGLMLIIFSFSISPRILLHDWLANHKDTSAKAPVTGQQQVGKQLYNCNCDNIVAESPFTQQDNSFTLTVFKPLSIQQETKPVVFYSVSYFFFSLRGPPAFC